MENNLLLRINMSKIKCGVPIPGCNQKQHKDLIDEHSKLRDFLYVIPMLWSSIVSFGISIYMMETQSEYYVRVIFTVFCIFMLCILTYLTDLSLYEKTKPSPTIVTKFDDSNYVKMKLSMGCNLDTEFELNKREKMEKQQNIQKYVICFVNLIVTFISLIGKDIAQLHAFSNISWMLGSLADNIKSLQYYTYMSEFLTITKTFEEYKLIANGITPIGLVNNVDFINASFGYYNDDLTNNPTQIQKIFNLTYTFKRGVFYYLESPNGVGKSTMLRMFSSNLFAGDIYFGCINRKNLTFEEINSNIFHIVQASEYTPKFNQDEIKSYQGRDIWLEKQLGLTDLLDKDTVELSGGQKKRLFIYIVLTSNAQILLLDEILSELSTEETPDVPEGGGWLQRVINTLNMWDGRSNKIMILVGHGLLNLIPPDVIKLKLEEKNNKTFLTTR
jgi:energy-coupling factor transporter ATP-binding protein EcfA2